MNGAKESDSAELQYSPQASTFLVPNGICKSGFELTDIEMISIQSLTYTSLRDLLPPSRSSMSIASPTHNSSWHEIPIKNPLVKHAAWAYLQPMSTAPELDDRNCLVKLKDKCCFGCVAFFSEFVVRGINRVVSCVFSERREEDEDDDDDDEYDEDEDRVD